MIEIKNGLDYRELRIGNWMQGCNKKYFQVDRYSFIDLHDFADLKQGCPSPIPLTPKILGKAGFKRNITHTPIHKIKMIDYRQGNFVLYIIPTGCEVEFAPSFAVIDERSHLCTIHHLHQLQNLYYALTNTELSITL